MDHASTTNQQASMIVPVMSSLDLALFEEQDRAERHYRQIYAILQDGQSWDSDRTLNAAARAETYVESAGDQARQIVRDLGGQIRMQQYRVTSHQNQVASRLHGLTLLEEVREKGDRILAVHTNVALAGRAITDFALVSAWQVNGLIGEVPEDRLHRTAFWLHAYLQERRGLWLDRLSQITGITDRVSLEDLTVKWTSPHFQRSEWVIGGLPSGYDADPELMDD